MFSLEDLSTDDGLIHQGIIAEPEEGGSVAIAWIHGLTGTFYGNVSLITELARQTVRHKMAFGSFNTRGHDMIAGFRKIDPTRLQGYGYRTIGAGYEVFEECVQDIDAVIRYFLQKGYQKVILVGHSSGANKVCYYAGSGKRSFLHGVALFCPISDRLDPYVDKTEIQRKKERCRSLIASGKGDELLTDLHFFPLTPKRYLILMDDHSIEDQFGYGDSPPRMPYYERIRLPLFVLFAERDEYADRPVRDIKTVFDAMQRSSWYASTIIPESYHSLRGFESSCVTSLFSWIQTIPK